MVEYLKNNPSALRHCLLYEFIQGESFTKQYQDFCLPVRSEVTNSKISWYDRFAEGRFDEEPEHLLEILQKDKLARRVFIQCKSHSPGFEKYAIFEKYEILCHVIGYDVITFECFKFLFDRFAEGRFNNEPPKNLLEVFQNDECALRACFLFEFLLFKKKCYLKATHHFVVFESYETLCNVFGDDVVKYQEFDFWFHRFVNGLFDLDFERDTDKKALELTNIPSDILETIVEELEYFDRENLRCVSRNVRDFIDTTKCIIKEFSVVFSYLNTFINIENVPTTYTNTDDEPIVYSSEIRYSKMRSRKAIKQIRKIFENPKLELKMFEIRTDSRFDYIEDIFESSISQIKVKHLKMTSECIRYFIQLLRNLEPGYLETIEMCCEMMYVPEIDSQPAEMFKTEQWKRAKHLKAAGYKHIRMAFEELFHFETFRIHWPNFYSVEMKKIKDILFKSSHFMECIIGFGYLDDNYLAGIREEIGSSPIPNVDPPTYHYPIPNSKDHHFEIVVFANKIHITRIC